MPFQLALSPMTIYCTTNNEFSTMNYAMLAISVSTILLPIAILLKRNNPNEIPPISEDKEEIKSDETSEL